MYQIVPRLLAAPACALRGWPDACAGRLDAPPDVVPADACVRPPLVESFRAPAPAPAPTPASLSIAAVGLMRSAALGTVHTSVALAVVKATVAVMPGSSLPPSF